MQNDTRRRVIYAVLTGLSGPLIAILADSFHLTDHTVQLWLNFAAAVSAIYGTVWGINVTATPEIVKSTSHIEGVQVHVNPEEAAAELVTLARTKVPELADIVPMTGPNGHAVPVQKVMT